MKNVTSQLPTDTFKAKVMIEGLFVFCINEGKKCAEFGVYEFADEHNFSIKINKLTYDVDEPEYVGETIEIKPGSNDNHMNYISIGVKDREADLSVYQNDLLGEKIFRSDPKKIKDINPNKEEYESDFRWVIDVEGARFHNRRLEITPGTLDRKIKILNGVLSTHEIGARIVKNAFPKASKQPPPTERCYVTYQLAVDLITDSTDNPIVVSYGASSSDVSNEICLMPSEDFYYLITLDNNCLRPENVSKHFSDFQHYYNVLAEVPIGERYDFEKYDGTGSKTTPCDLIFLGQHEDL